jgi:hypothetical protein
MGVIEITDLSDDVLEQLEKYAAEIGVTPEKFARDMLEGTIRSRNTRSGVKFNTMYGKLGALKDHDWEAPDLEEIEAWDNPSLP